MFMVRTVYAALSSTSPTPVIPFSFTPNGRRTHGFVATTLRAMCSSTGSQQCLCDGCATAVLLILLALRAHMNGIPATLT